jgi:DMSO/TMAO reductase YedYZ molybdopterin-dependent catalytic subunit
MNDASASQAIPEGIDPRLIVLSDRPLVLETPLGLLAEERITDKRRLFVRDVQDLDGGLTARSLPIEGWEIVLSGLIAPSRVVIRAKDLLKMNQVEHEMVLVCSGNGRANYGGIPGVPWGPGGVGNVRFSGVPLSAVLEQQGVRIDPQVKFVAAEGRDQPLGPEKPDFEHSLPLADVLERSLLALKLNGEDLPGVHGGPVRLVTPGFYGTMQVKWLSRLRFEASESLNFYHTTDYRVPLKRVRPGERFRFTLENSRPTWSLRVMSYILQPDPDAVLPAGPVTIRGVAYNDGAAPLEAVLVSFDRGESWTAAALTRPDSPYAWCPWTMTADLQPGRHEIWSRAIDALGRSQPLDGSIYWNPNGHEWNGVYKIQVTVQ